MTKSLDEIGKCMAKLATDRARRLTSGFPLLSRVDGESEKTLKDLDRPKISMALWFGAFPGLGSRTLAFRFAFKFRFSEHYLEKGSPIQGHTRIGEALNPPWLVSLVAKGR